MPLPKFLPAFALLSAAAPFLVAANAASDADNGGLALPAGFHATIVADHLMAGRAHDALRFLAVAPNGDVYAKTAEGGIFALRGVGPDGRFAEQHEFGSGGGTCVAVHDDWLYASTTTAVYRYHRAPDQLVPSGEPEEIVGGLEDAHQHNAKCFAFDGEGRLLIEQGCGYNVYSEGDREQGAKGKEATEYLKTHGGFWRYDANKLHQTLADGFHFSTGHRHSLAIAWQPVSQTFFMVMMGRDNMNTVAPEYYDELDNAERVAEEMHRLHEGVNLGWPYTYWDPYKKARMICPEFGGDNRKRAEVGKYDEPVIAFPAHWAPLQMTFYTGTQFPARYRNGAFVAFHGSWNRAPLPQDGFNLTFVPFDEKGQPLGTHEVFAANAGPRRFRMGGVAVAPDGSLYLSETDDGRIWHIVYTGEGSGGTAASGVAAVPAEAPKVGNPHGRQLYTQVCAVCHMPDGKGAGQMQPALAGSAVVAGDLQQVIAVVLRGPAAVLPANRPRYQNVMPQFDALADKDVADLVSYVRTAFGSGASPVTTADVAQVRASFEAK